MGPHERKGTFLPDALNAHVLGFRSLSHLLRFDVVLHLGQMFMEAACLH